MSDYIKREDAIRAFKNRSGLSEADLILTSEEIKETINAIPAADVRENVRGKWIGSSVGYKCSVCGFWIDDEVFFYLTEPIIDDGFIYCPNCGADMRSTEETKEENDEN